MRVLSLFNIKGGVGKTSASINLAHQAARAGYRTVIWDLDPQGAASFTFRIRPRVAGGLSKVLKKKEDAHGLLRASDYADLDVLPAEFGDHDLEPRHVAESGAAVGVVLRQLASSYDFAFLDCPPGMSALAEGVFDASDALLCPTVPTPLSLRTLAQLMGHLKSRKGHRPLVFPFFSMVDRRKALHRSVCAWVAEQALGFLAGEVPYSSLIEQMAVRREPLFALAPRSPAVDAFERLWRELEQELELRREPPSSVLYAKASRRSIERVIRSGTSGFSAAPRAPDSGPISGSPDSRLRPPLHRPVRRPNEL